MPYAVRGLGVGSNTPAKCRQDSACSSIENAWCYSGGYFTDACIAWRAGLDNPPMPVAPVVPVIDTAGGSTAANPDYGRTSATVDDIISETAAIERQRLSDWFGETADRTAAIGGDAGSELSLLTIAGIGLGVLVVGHYVFGGGR